MKTVVVKIGGSLMEQPDLLNSLTAGLAKAVRAGVRLVLAHGGGKDINRNLAWLGEEPKFKDGLRITSDAALEIVEMTLSGSVNKRLVGLIQDHGIAACGISGVDGPTLLCSALDPELGRVGAVERVDARLITSLLAADFLPVISPISIDAKGLHYNVNADDAASSLGMALEADRLIFISDVPGVLDLQKRILPELDRDEILRLIAHGVAVGGMIPKLRSCIKAAAAGVGEVHICGMVDADQICAQVLGHGNSGTIIKV